MTQKESAKPEAPQQAVIPPKPKFEFYTLLANEKHRPHKLTMQQQQLNPLLQQVPM